MINRPFGNCVPSKELCFSMNFVELLCYVYAID